jgi:hypothetical protein
MRVLVNMVFLATAPRLAVLSILLKDNVLSAELLSVYGFVCAGTLTDPFG